MHEGGAQLDGAWVPGLSVLGLKSLMESEPLADGIRAMGSDGMRTQTEKTRDKSKKRSRKHS